MHPSGVLALSVSRDRTLKTWSLITGKPVHTVNLQTLPDKYVDCAGVISFLFIAVFICAVYSCQKMNFQY